MCFFFSSRRRHTRLQGDWSSDVCSSDLGQIQLMFENPPTVLSHIRGGKLKALAVTGSQRLPALPDVPTAAESGLKDYVATSWTTVAVSSKVPEAIVKKLNDDIRKVVATPEFRKGLQEQGMSAVANKIGRAHV